MRQMAVGLGRSPTRPPEHDLGPVVGPVRGRESKEHLGPPLDDEHHNDDSELVGIEERVINHLKKDRLFADSTAALKSGTSRHWAKQVCKHMTLSARKAAGRKPAAKKAGSIVIKSNPGATTTLCKNRAGPRRPGKDGAPCALGAPGAGETESAKNEDDGRAGRDWRRR